MKMGHETGWVELEGLTETEAGVLDKLVTSIESELSKATP